MLKTECVCSFLYQDRTLLTICELLIHNIGQKSLEKKHGFLSNIQELLECIAIS